MSATAADFQAALDACRMAVNHGTDVSGSDLVRIIRCLEFSLDNLDTTAILPPTPVEPVQDG